VPKILRARPAVDAAEEQKIRRLAGARHAPGDWIQRAGIVALSWDGHRVPVIAVRLGCGEKTVRRWLHRFNAAGLDGLGDRPGVGRKRRITEAERSRLIALVKTGPPGRLVRQGGGELYAADEAGPPVWTLDTLTAAARADGIDIHRSQVRTVLLAEGVRWRRTRSWMTSKDPDFAGKGRGSSRSTPIRPPTRRSSAPTSSAR
jgi:transposase